MFFAFGFSHIKYSVYFKNLIVLHLQILETWAFEGCGKLKTISFPKNLKVIENDALVNCRKLRKITFADNGNITNIGDEAFKNCNSLKKIVIKSKKAPKIGKNAFANINKKAVFYVKSNNINKLKKNLTSVKSGFSGSMKIQKGSKK